MEDCAPEKLGAGLLFMSQGDVLLLKRSATSGNPCTLGLPGGNADPEDEDLTATARREAEEEMGGTLPAFSILGQCLVKRGKRHQKHYTVFLAAVDGDARDSWTPQLNEEHTEYAWMPLETAASRIDLHPVVQRVLNEEPHRQMVLDAMAAS